MDDASIISFFLLWSTSEPNQIPPNKFSTKYTPPSIPVTKTECVSRYAQNVIANQRSILVKPAMAEFARM